MLCCGIAGSEVYETRISSRIFIHFFFLFYNFCLEMDEEVYLKEHRFCFAPGVPCGVEHLSF